MMVGIRCGNMYLISKHSLTSMEYGGGLLPVMLWVSKAESHTKRNIPNATILIFLNSTRSSHVSLQKVYAFR